MTQDIIPSLQILGNGNIPASPLLDQFIRGPLAPVIPALVDLEEFKRRLVHVVALAIAVREVVQHRAPVVFRPCAPGDSDRAASGNFSGDVGRYCASMADDIGGMQILDEALVGGLGGPGDEPRGFADVRTEPGIFFAGDVDFSDVPVGCHCGSRS